VPHNQPGQQIARVDQQQGVGQNLHRKGQRHQQAPPEMAMPESASGRGFLRQHHHAEHRPRQPADSPDHTDVPAGGVGQPLAVEGQGQAAQQGRPCRQAVCLVEQKVKANPAQAQVEDE
jgi:hypothetical protein